MTLPQAKCREGKFTKSGPSSGFVPFFILGGTTDKHKLFFESISALVAEKFFAINARSQMEFDLFKDLYFPEVEKQNLLFASARVFSYY